MHLLHQEIYKNKEKHTPLPTADDHYGLEQGVRKVRDIAQHVQRSVVNDILPSAVGNVIDFPESEHKHDRY